MADRFELVTTVLRDAERILRALDGFDANLVQEDGAYRVEIRPDREFNALMLGVLEAAYGCIVREGMTDITLVIDDRSYPLAAAR